MAADPRRPDPPEDGEWSERRAQQRRRRRRLRIALGIPGGVLLLLCLPWELKVRERTVVRPAFRHEVRATVEGVFVEVRKAEGDRVESGEVIAVLDQREQRARRAVLAAELASAEAELDKLRRGSRPEEIERASEVVARRQSEVVLARAQLERAERLHAQDLVTDEDLETAQTHLAVGESELAAAAAELELVRAGFRREDVRAQEATIERTRAQIAYVDSEIARSEVRSVTTGILLTPRFEERVGEAVEPGDLVAEVAELDRMRVEILVPERQLDVVTVGQLVVMKVRSYPYRDFRGRVAFIPPIATAAEVPPGRVVRVTAYVDNSDRLLRDQMTGWAEIYCGRRPILWLILRPVIRWLRVRFVF